MRICYTLHVCECVAAPPTFTAVGLFEYTFGKKALGDEYETGARPRAVYWRRKRFACDGNVGWRRQHRRHRQMPVLCVQQRKTHVRTVDAHENPTARSGSFTRALWVIYGPMNDDGEHVHAMQPLRLLRRAIRDKCQL